MVWVGDAFDILWSILFTGLNTTYILAYHFGVYQISRDLWTLTLWLFLAKRNRRAIIMTAHTYIQKGNSHTIEPKWSILDCIRKPFMNPILGALHFEYSWHVRIITLRVSFSLNANGKEDRRRFGLALTKKWTFTKWKHRAHSSIIKQPSRNKMKPRKICMRLANKLEMVACHSCYIGSYSKVSQRWKKYRTCMNKMEMLTRNKANKT